MAGCRPGRRPGGSGSGKPTAPGSPRRATTRIGIVCRPGRRPGGSDREDQQPPAHRAGLQQGSGSVVGQGADLADYPDLFSLHPRPIALPFTAWQIANICSAWIEFGSIIRSISLRLAFAAVAPFLLPRRRRPFSVASGKPRGSATGGCSVGMSSCRTTCIFSVPSVRRGRNTRFPVSWGVGRNGRRKN